MIEHMLKLIDENYLCPTYEEIEKSEIRARQLVNELELLNRKNKAKMYEITQVIDHGSVSRNTALRNFRDLDKILLLNPLTLRTQQEIQRSPRDTISRMARIIRERRAGLISMDRMRIRSQDHSIGVIYNHSNFAIDFVPAIQRHDIFLIPEKSTNSWIITDPFESKKNIDNIEDFFPHIRTTIRLLKGWSRARGRNVHLPSFAIETLITNKIKEQSIKNISDIIYWFFSSSSNFNKNSKTLNFFDLNSIYIDSLVIIDPKSNQNITRKMKKESRNRFIDSSRISFKKLNMIMDLYSKIKHRNSAFALAKELFVPKSLR